MHFYSFNPSAYLLDTAHLTPMQDLAYRRLLDLYYVSERPIPLETELVATRLRLGCELVTVVLNEFFTRTNEGYIQQRCEEQIAAYQARCSAARKNGTAGGRPRADNKTELVSKKKQTLTQDKANANLTSNYKLGTSRVRTIDQFEQFWMEYPKRIGKGQAVKAFAKAIKVSGLEEILAGLAKSKNSRQWTENDGRFIPHASTWLNALGWQDEPIPAQQSPIAKLPDALPWEK
jgi:uncharacterized protein YdaU (DUF1376 family)